MMGFEVEERRASSPLSGYSRWLKRRVFDVTSGADRGHGGGARVLSPPKYEVAGSRSVVHDHFFLNESVRAGAVHHYVRGTVGGADSECRGDDARRGAWSAGDLSSDQRCRWPRDSVFEVSRGGCTEKHFEPNVILRIWRHRKLQRWIIVQRVVTRDALIGELSDRSRPVS
jgi:hypothetical protein